jgi:hypothetical protein
LNEISKEVSNTKIRKRKMEHKSSKKAKPKTKKVRFNLYVPGTKRVFSAGDFNSSLLVIPEVFGIHKNIALVQGRPPEYHL